MLAVGEHLFDICVEVSHELHELKARRHWCRRLLSHQVLRHFQIVHPVQEFRTVGFRHAKNLAERIERQAGGKQLDHVASSLRRHLVQHAGDFRDHLGIELVQISRREEGHMLATQLQVLRRVEIDHGVERGALQQNVPHARLGRHHQDAATL